MASKKLIMWLAGKHGTEFLQFAAARITRKRLPEGGYYYTATDSGTQEPLYVGSNYESARAACVKAHGGER